jgi:probable HAF family extracellular repeat protein
MNSQSFFGPFGGKLKSFRFIFNGKPVAVTQAFGCNDNSEIVGTFTDSAGHVHGFLTAFNGVNFIDFDVFDAPGSQQKLAFGVQGTLINGVNDAGDLVGFFSDGTKVHGFVYFVQPVNPE